MSVNNVDVQHSQYYYYCVDGKEGEADGNLDAEVAQIDFQNVHMRPKKTNKQLVDADVAKKEQEDVEEHDEAGEEEEDVPARPMSWEGELSDGVDMCIDDNTAVINKHSDLNPEQNDDETIIISNHHIEDDVESNEEDDNSGRMESDSLSSVMLHSINARTTTKKPVNENNLIEFRSIKTAAASSISYSSLQNTPTSSPLMSQRNAMHLVNSGKVPATPSPDSAIHSAYSVFSSPSQSPLTQRHHILSTPSLSRNNSDASHSSCCSYSSVSVSLSPTQQFSPTHSPIQGRHHYHLQQHHQQIYRNIQEEDSQQQQQYVRQLVTTTGNELFSSTEHDSIVVNNHLVDDGNEDKTNIIHTSSSTSGLPAAGPGISRQQLINSPCPICGDKISGFHYGIFSCESCKGFFKRTVQNRKNYVCLRGAICPVTVATRKKCPACRFDKCLQCGMKLEAIREDRTRGGRSTYQCSYTLPASLIVAHSELRQNNEQQQQQQHAVVKLEPMDSPAIAGGSSSSLSLSTGTTKFCDRTNNVTSTSPRRHNHHHHHHHHHHHSVPPLLQEIMDVEHLWHYSEGELTKLNLLSNSTSSSKDDGSGTTTSTSSSNTLSTHPLLASTGLASSTAIDTNPDFIANLCNIADHRLYKIVKWCKSLPLFKNISIDDQICLLINSWCELLLFSCCYRSISTPGEIRVSLGKSINLCQAREMGLQACIERMLNFTDHLRRLRVDRYEYVAMKVIVLLTSDTSELREAEKVRASQEKALQALQGYTLTHYPDIPAKFGELLLRIPELQRTCQVGKDMLTIKSKDGEEPSFNLLMELLRGDH